jgi:hypothetical protein
MLDRDLAALCRVTTFNLNKVVKGEMASREKTPFSLIFSH